MKKVSIIIPVYNNKEFLTKCLDSVMNQTLKDIEIIIVNDGSTDGSLFILKNYADVYSNIVLLNQDNKGQAIAINRALDIATGKYIAFVDADDYIEPEMIETLYESAETDNLDLVICNWNRVDQNGNILSYYNHSNFESKVLDKYEVIREFFLNKEGLVEGYSWNKLIKRSLFSEFNIRYPNIKYEDIPAIFRVLTKINHCKYVNKCLYHYVQHNTQLTQTKNKENIKGYIQAIQMIGNILVEENLILEFNDEYFLYKSNRYLAEYYESKKIINRSSELAKMFKTILKSITIQKCITVNKPIDFKHLIKVLLFKMGLFHIFKRLSKYKITNKTIFPSLRR